MKKNVLLIMLMIMIIFTSCSEMQKIEDMNQDVKTEIESNTSDTDNNIKEENKKDVNSGKDQNINNNQANTYEISSERKIECNFELFDSAETMEIKYYSPDEKNYIKEKMGYYYEEMSYINYKDYYINDQVDIVLSDAGNLFIPKEKNLSPSPLWISDNTVILSSSSVRKDITGKLIEISGTESMISELYGYFSASINETKDKIALNGHFHKVMIYDLIEEDYQEIYKTNYEYRIDQMHLNIAWGINDIIYIDDLILEDSKTPDNPKPLYSIKKYDPKTGQISNFIDKGYLINLSPDKRFLVYVDETREKTVVLDLVKDMSFDIPLTNELEWMPDSKGFYYSPMKLYGEGLFKELLTSNGREVTEYALTNILAENQCLINIRYDIELGWIFDIAEYDSSENGVNLSKGVFKSFSTYKIIEEQ